MDNKTLEFTMMFLLGFGILIAWSVLNFYVTVRNCEQIDKLSKLEKSVRELDQQVKVYNAHAQS